MNALLLVAAAAGLSAPAFEAPPLPSCPYTLPQLEAEASRQGTAIWLVDMTKMLGFQVEASNLVVVENEFGATVGVQFADGCVSEPIFMLPRVSK